MAIDGEFILRGFSKIGYDAINIGENDLSLGYNYLIDLQRKFEIPFISANLYRRDKNEALFQPYTIKDLLGLRVAIFGVLRNDPTILRSCENDQELYIIDPVIASKKIVKDLSDRCDLIIALTNLGYENSMEFVKQVDGIDLLISSHNAFREKQAIKINETIIAQSKYQGQNIGDLLLYLDKNNDINNFEDLSRPLNETIIDDPKFNDLLSEYRQKIASENKNDNNRNTSAPPVTKSIGYYVGSKTCQACHAEQYLHWTKTKHATAFDSISSGNDIKDRECYPCHTTGFLTSNGFRNLQTTPDMIQVQCEECHGTRFTHVRIHTFTSEKTRSAKASLQQLDNQNDTINAATCTRCHTEERDRDFDYQTALKQVSH